MKYFELNQFGLSANNIPYISGILGHQHQHECIIKNYCYILPEVGSKNTTNPC